MKLTGKQLRNLIEQTMNEMGSDDTVRDVSGGAEAMHIIRDQVEEVVSMLSSIREGLEGTRLHMDAQKLWDEAYMLMTAIDDELID